MDIILVRHGESEDNVRKAYSLDETPLTKNGRSQILRTKTRLLDFKYRDIYVSPILRAKETAHILELEGVDEECIKEMDFGIFKGNTFDEITNRYPKETDEWQKDIYNYSIPGGESIVASYNRISEFLDRISKREDNVLLVTHDGIIRLALCWVLGSVEHFFKFRLNNGSITVISVGVDYKSIKNVNLV